MWIKKMKSSLTVKICLMISILLLLSSGITYAAVAGFLPVVYSNQLEESLEELSAEMSETLNTYDSIEQAGAALELFAASTELSVAVLDREGALVWPARQILELSVQSSAESSEATVVDVSEEEVCVTEEPLGEIEVGEQQGDEMAGAAGREANSDNDVSGIEESSVSTDAAAGSGTDTVVSIGAATESVDDTVVSADAATESVDDTVVSTGAATESADDTVVSVNKGGAEKDAANETEGVNSVSEEAVEVSQESTAEYWDAIVSEFLDESGNQSYYVAGKSVNYDYMSEAELAGFSGKDASAIKQYDLKLGGTPYKMLVAGGMQPVNQAVEILRQIFPYILGLAVVTAVLFALAGSLYLTAPVVRLSRISRKMAALDFSDQYCGRRQDEIGELGRNLNEMASNLSDTLRNLKMANDRLKSDIEMERELELKRITFFSAVSHELKTPITILKGHISGMLRGIGAYQDRDYYLQRSQETTEKMEDMVGELLTVSRMESNTFVTQIADLAELMRLQLADLTELMEEKELELETNLPEHLYAEVNSGMMEKVFRNFLTNAIRYTPPGNGNKICVTLYENAQNSVFCSVENTGVQIPADDMPHLFDAFYRVESSRSRKTGGSGLGLYIVRMALEQHGASYGAENTKEGVRFYFIL